MKSSGRMEDIQFLDSFEKTLQDGLLRLCKGYGHLEGGLLESPDLEQVWDSFIKDYIADAVENFNSWPDASLAWAAYLGMGVANNWDRNWERHCSDPYTSYYGSKGWDDMDEHIVFDQLGLDKSQADALSQLLLSCSQACLALIRHENIEPQTSTGFYCLARAYSVFFRIGASLELERLAYRKIIVR